MSALPTDEDIDQAIPPNSIPQRGLTNALLKSMRDSIAQAALIPDASQAPTDSSDAGSPGQTAFDDNYMYLCVAPNIWRRFVLEEF